MLRALVPLAFGVAGVAILVSLGVWQVKRLAWKEAVLANVEERIAADSVPLPAKPDPVGDKYLPVAADGTLTGEMLAVLASVRRVGAIHRIVAVLDLGTRRVLVDRGYRPLSERAAYRTRGALAVTGNLHWPDELDRFTPAPENRPDGMLHFARDVAAMSAELGTDPVLIVAREAAPRDPQIVPLPVSIDGIPNDHLEYAVTWFSLAAAWAGMTVFLLWRIRRRKA